MVTDSSRALKTLHVHSSRVNHIESLISLLDPKNPVLWLRNGEGIVGFGTALRLEFHGKDRITEAGKCWREISQSAAITDQVNLPGTGLVAFGAFSFSEKSTAPSVLIIPQIIVGLRNGIFWVTHISQQADGELSPPLKSSEIGGHQKISLQPGALTPENYQIAVEQAMTKIQNGELEKIVLARDLIGRLPLDVDRRRATLMLAENYPDCWTFAVDGLFGSSPETLVKVANGAISSRVLAGTTVRGGTPEEDRQAEASLLGSTKDQWEHQLAVENVLKSLKPHTKNLKASSHPFSITLPNLWHLASDINGVMNDASHALDLVAALHPTAAVAGTPTDVAVQLISELEPFDRGRYAGPVGWIDAEGNGEWAIALRCAQWEPDGKLTAYAGAGIVADSSAQKELEETSLKFQAIMTAFS